MKEPRIVCGVEVHVQLATRTKAFCACPAEFGAEANTLGCPVCLGHPGALPVLNRAALEAALRGGLALGCAVAPRGRTLFDRKNYFYPDLPKGYQITQYEFPLCGNGEVVLSDGTKVRVRRAHLEEDTGKSSHAEHGETLLDFNRCGVPLLEIVTEPDLRTPAEVEEYLRLLQERMRTAGASECSMEKGQMRCEPNVSLAREDGSSTAISELKNLNSFAAAREAVAFEAKRLAAGPWHPKGSAPPRATYGWDDAGKRTILQRTKETAADYRYFQEPDLPVLPAEALAPFVLTAMADLAERERKRSDAASSAKGEAERLGLSPEQADALLVKDVTGGLFRSVVETAGADAAPEIARWFLGPLAGWVNGRGGDWGAVKATPTDFSSLVLFKKRGLSKQIIKEHLLSGDWPSIGGDPEQFLRSRGISLILEASATAWGITTSSAIGTVLKLEDFCLEAVKANPDVVAKIRSGKVQAKAALVGHVMKRTKGTADPVRVNAILDELLR